MLICELTESWETDKQNKQNVTIFLQKKIKKIFNFVLEPVNVYHKNTINRKLKFSNDIGIWYYCGFPAKNFSRSADTSPK